MKRAAPGELTRRAVLLSMCTAGFAAAGCAVSPASSSTGLPTPPRHRREIVNIERYGMRRTDAYAWMKPSDWHAILRGQQALFIAFSIAVVDPDRFWRGSR